MTAATKSNSKWILTTIGSMVATFIVVITATVKVTTEFNRNNLDHTVIKSELATEINRSTDIDQARESDLKKINEKLDDVKTTQTKVVTNQERIKQDIQKISDKIGIP